MSVPPEKMMAIVLFSIPWFMSLYEIYRGLSQGKMREYSRSSYQEESGFDQKPDKFCHRQNEPKTFWCLFMMYTAFAILIPIGIGYAITHPSQEPKVNPGRTHQERNHTSASQRVPRDV